MELTADEYLEHFGKKGMKWGVRNRANNVSPTNKNRVKKVITVGAGLGAAAAVGAILGRKGHISVSAAQTLANKKGGQAIRDIGHRFVKDSIDKKVVLNYGRQVREGLYNL